MSLTWSSVKSLSIPVGGVSRDVKRVTAGGVTLWEKPNPLPYDAEVEYLGGNPTADNIGPWIDTGWVPKTSSGNGLRVVASYSGVNQAKCLWGVNIGGYYQLNKTANASELRLHTTGASQQLFTVDAISSAHEYYINGRQMYVDNTLKTTGGSGSTATGTVALFGRHGANGCDQIGVWRIFSAKVYADGVLFRDFIPVRVGSGTSAVGYLYDRANPTGGPLGNGLYPNSGSGAFVVGPDKSS